jgi:probable addiction module antidote protein
MKPLPLETVPFDAAPYLTDEASQLALLADALESGESAYIAAAIGTIARARGMTDIARRSGVGRTALYRALSADGDPKLSTVVGVVKALGLKLSISTDPAA